MRQILVNNLSLSKTNQVIWFGFDFVLYMVIAGGLNKLSKSANVLLI